MYSLIFSSSSIVKHSYKQTLYYIEMSRNRCNICRQRYYGSYINHMNKEKHRKQVVVEYDQNARDYLEGELADWIKTEIFRQMGKEENFLVERQMTRPPS